MHTPLFSFVKPKTVFKKMKENPFFWGGKKNRKKNKGRMGKRKLMCGYPLSCKNINKIIHTTPRVAHIRWFSGSSQQSPTLSIHIGLETMTNQPDSMFILWMMTFSTVKPQKKVFPAGMRTHHAVRKRIIQFPVK